jgi:hypothetical protein
MTATATHPGRLVVTEPSRRRYGLAMVVGGASSPVAPPKFQA